MKYKLLGAKSEESLNIGDYIQAVASSQFYPQIDGFIEREALKEYDGDVCKVIMNGWYMHHPEHWPPSPQIKPLFVAFHINSSVKDRFLKDDSLKYLKEHEPIGCRDMKTMNLLKENGVDAYFSGCMTLTLGEKYKSISKNGKIYFVDPYIKVERNIKALLSIIWNLIINFKKVKTISNKYNDDKITLRKLIRISSFIKTYSQKFDIEDLLNAEYRVHDTPNLKKKYSTDEKAFNYAQDLIKSYSQEKYVVTSRIHCALPCLGMETPVIYISGENLDEAHTCRLDGLIQLFNIFRWEQGNLISDAENNATSPIPANKDLHIPLVKSLKQKCLDFIEKDI